MSSRKFGPCRIQKDAASGLSSSVHVWLLSASCWVFCCVLLLLRCPRSRPRSGLPCDKIAEQAANAVTALF